MVDIGLSATHSNTSESRNFDIELTGLGVVYCMVLNWFDGNIFFLNYVCLYITWGNLVVSVDQQHDLPTQTQNKTGNLRITVILCWDCINNVYVENL